jgi:hypothetical protein
MSLICPPAFVCWVASCAIATIFPPILTPAQAGVIKKTQKTHKIWIKFDPDQRYFANFTGYSGYQLSLNHLIARFRDRAG